MKRFKRILFATDTRLSGHPIVNEAAEIAKNNRSSLNIVDVVPDFPWTVRLTLDNHEHMRELIAQEKQAELERLAAPIRQMGVEAETKVLMGKTSIEIIREVLRGDHDLVLRMAKGIDSTRQAFFGDTAFRLLRKCPCPVWITKPRERQEIGSVLVANDLSPISDLALELGVSIAGLQQAQLHVLHVLELGLGRPEWDSYEIRERARAEATQRLEDQLVRVGAANLTKPPHIDIVVDAADTAIIPRIEQCEIDLLVMGTVARGGIAGVLMGNTAERLLPRISCSVLAVKPDDFICPVGIQ